MINIHMPNGEIIQMPEYEAAEGIKILWDIVNAIKHNDPHSVDKALAKAFTFFANLKTVDQCD